MVVHRAIDEEFLPVNRAIDEEFMLVDRALVQLMEYIG
jgi:hypothetical protein